MYFDTVDSPYFSFCVFCGVPVNCGMESQWHSCFVPTGGFLGVRLQCQLDGFTIQQVVDYSYRHRQVCLHTVCSLLLCFLNGRNPIHPLCMQYFDYFGANYLNNCKTGMATVDVHVYAPASREGPSTSTTPLCTIWNTCSCS